MLPGRTPLLLPVVLLVLASGPGRAAPVPKEETSAFVPFPAGIADAAGKVASVANTEGAIDALDLARGKVLWSTREPGKPLALAGKLLAVQAPVKGKANAVRVVLFDTSAKGKRVRASEAL